MNPFVTLFERITEEMVKSTLNMTKPDTKLVKGKDIPVGTLFYSCNGDNVLLRTNNGYVVMSSPSWNIGTDSTYSSSDWDKREYKICPPGLSVTLTQE